MNDPLHRSASRWRLLALFVFLVAAMPAVAQDGASRLAAKAERKPDASDEFFKRGEIPKLRIDIADPVAIVNVLFAQRPGRCHDALDADDDGALALGDALRILQYLFEGAAPPPAPFPAPGPDGTDDDLRCFLFP